MEEKGEIPDGGELLKPEGVFCLSTKICSQKNFEFQQKIYINICVEPKIEDSTFEQSDGGQNWSVPHVVGQMRFDQDLTDGKKEVVNVIDVIFGSNVKGLCLRQVQFRNMVFGISLDSVQKVLDGKKETVSKDYQLLKANCKGAKPQLMVYRGRKSALGDNEKPKLYYEIEQMKNQAAQKP